MNLGGEKGNGQRPRRKAEGEKEASEWMLDSDDDIREADGLYYDHNNSRGFK